MRGENDERGAVSTLTTPGPEDAPPIRGSRRRYDPAWDDWRRPRRWPGVLLTSVVVLAFIGVVVWHYRPHTAHKAPTVYQQIGVGKVFGPFVPLADGHGASVRMFRGTRSAQHLRFATDGKLLVMHAICDCTYNFVVTITNPIGSPVAFPVTSTGPFDGTMNVTLPAGLYFLNVVAPTPAAWKVQLIQPGPSPPVIPTPFKYPPGKFVTLHPSVLGPFSASDRFLYFKFFSATNGTGRVYVVDPAGVHVDQVFYVRALFSNGRTLPNPPQPYYVEVDASGYWQLRVQHSAHG